MEAVALPRPLRAMIAQAREVAPELVPAIEQHYLELMPAQRAAQLAGDEPLLHERLDWSRLPRLTAAIDRFYALLDAHGVAGVLAPTAVALRADTRTLAALYVRTHYGGCMPLLYGTTADFGYIASRGLDAHAAIDRYLVSPILHELCHFAPERDALPPHLDECVAGWIAVHVWPEFAYPEPGCDDAIFASPWLSQIGQAFARAFGIGPLVRAHAGTIAWREALPAELVDRLERACRDDWAVRRTLHFLSNTLDPAPWIAFALERGLADDPAFDRAIVGDALRAMCLETECIAGSFRTRSCVADAPIEIDARTGWVTREAKVAAHASTLRYWLPPAVAATIRARGHTGYTLYLGGIAAIERAVATVCDGASPSGFTLVAG